MQTILRRGAIGLALMAVLFVGASSVSADTSGPNSSGYNWVDSNAPGPTTTFNWMDATGGTITPSSGCDDCHDTVGLPFTFNFFGTDYNMVDIGTNGQLSFNTADPNDCNDNYNWDDRAIPWGDADCENDGWSSNPLIAPWFDDLDPGECGASYYQTMGTAPNRMFVVQFEDVCHNDCDSCSPGEGITFETILFEGSNDIKVQFEDTFFGTGSTDLSEENNGGTATVGLNKDGTTGLQYSANQTVLTDNLAILFTTGAIGEPTATPIAPEATPITPTATPEANATVFTGDIEIVDDSCGDGTIALTVNPESTGITTVVVEEFMVSGSPNNLTLDFDPPIAINPDGSFSNTAPLPPPLDVINASLVGTFDFAADPATVSGTITIGLVADPGAVLCEADYTAEALAAGVVPPTATPVAVELPQTGTGAIANDTAGSGWLIAVLASAALLAGIGYLALHLRRRSA